MSEDTRMILEQLCKLGEQFSTVDNRITALGEVVSRMDERLSSIEEKISQLDERLSAVENKVTAIEEGFSRLNERLSVIEDRVSYTNDKIIFLDSRISEVQMTLENETNRGIHIIAEGHLDLTRKLDEALKIENEKEMMLLRMVSMENELRRMKNVLGATA